VKKKSEILKSKTPSDSFVVSRKLVMPDQINSMGSLFGGTVMSWIDKVGAMVAQLHSARPVVTASIDQISFLAPVRIGHHVVLEGFVTYVGKTSMEISVRVWAEDPITGRRDQTTQAYLTFVALDDQSRPTRVPELTLENKVQEKLYKEAETRVKTRAANRQRFQAQIGKQPLLTEVMRNSLK
jgi:acyl-CoA hydrolase